MNSPFINTQLDQEWYLQGRIIPPSCTNGDGCILHLQTRSHSWSNKHFHTGRIPINSEVGVEFAMSIIIPAESEMLRDSLESKEEDLDYLLMARLAEPEDSIAFPTINGLTIIIHNKGLNSLFGPSEKCSNCKAQESLSSLMLPSVSTNKFDSLMLLTGDERSH